MPILDILKKQFTLTSPRILILGFIIAIWVGTILLWLPVSSTNGKRISFLDALFTSTSAVCVTGLAVVDTGSNFSIFGQIILLILIQFGGLGFMTFGVIIAIVLGKKIGLKERLLIQQSTNSLSFQGVVRLAINIFLIASLLEIIGSILLTIRWYEDMGIKRAIYYSVFHTISSFNNAGFALWPDSLSRYVGDPFVNIIISVLFIFGGLGFSVIVDMYQNKKWNSLSLHTKVVLVTSGILSLSGFIAVFAIELFNKETFGLLSWGDRLWAGYFQGVVPRTAGFNTIDIGSMMTASELFFIFLMFIGASSGSTGGGIKTNTFAILCMTVYMIIRGRDELDVFKRRIAIDLILRALAVIIISLGVVIVATFILTISEHSLKKDFMEVLFEATSAFGTVGLSMGLTPELSPVGKGVIIVTMFIGRLGPLTLMFALSQRVTKKKFRYPEEKILIG
ncbi:Ktr system potassium transporter B [Paenibacillus sp. Soil766]|uniref:TrkH family potassium uptake protein n=1 Tax=Paenibacillus sp. Soil766 TaxID=1736404 RepID=UPI0007105B20|nr:TrkH family potassium uptake protein [Paenibacillus sp. Soil766]KRE96453.1 Ktr system potassium transporter B [Paenibacillus sp. Soil766]